MSTRPSNDDQPCATPDNREVSGLTNSEWVMVPRSPTDAMVDAGNEGAAPYMVNAHDLWDQMIAAAPTPPKAETAPTPDVIRDAKRYQWLRANCVREWVSIMPDKSLAPTLDIRFLHLGDDLDTAIDAAIREQRGEKDNG